MMGKRDIKITCKGFILLTLALLLFSGLAVKVHAETRKELQNLVLGLETEKQICNDYLTSLKNELPNDVYVQNLTVKDISVEEYYGTYQGCEAVFMSVKGLEDTDDEVEIKIAGYTFKFGAGSSVNRFLLHKESEFITVNEAYKEKILTTKDVYQIGINRGDIITPEELPYKDVKSDSGWYFEYVYDAYIKNLMTGLNAVTFEPEGALSRAQFVVVLHRIEEEPDAIYQDIFPDVADGSWFTNAILWASQNEIVTGYSNTKLFGPADKITREQMAVMMYRYAKYKGYDVSQKADLKKYQDSPKITAFAQEAMEWAVGVGIMEGKNDETLLDPQGNANRAECAAIISRFTNLY